MGGWEEADIGCGLQGPGSQHQGPEVSKGFPVRHWGATRNTKKSGGVRSAFQDCRAKERGGLGRRHLLHLTPYQTSSPLKLPFLVPHC